MGSAGARVEHRHWRFIRMQHREGEFGLQRIDQGLKLHTHLADPLGQRRLGNGEACPAEDAFLPVGGR